MADFLHAFGRTLQMEGGYVNDPDDHGGETKYGISRASFPNEDIHDLTLDRAYELYKKRYWDTLQLDLIRVQAVAEEIFDTAANMGPRRAATIAQESLNRLGVGVKVDGVFGPQTRNALNAYRDTDALLKVLNGRQFHHYEQIVTANPSQAKFFRGWMRRVAFGGAP